MGTPTYFRRHEVHEGNRRPDGGSGAREESSEPISTAGTLPTMINAVTPNSTCPKVSTPRAAAAVSGTACVRSGPDQFAGSEHQVDEQQQDDHQRRAHRHDPDDQAADHADQHGRDRADEDLRDLAAPPSNRPSRTYRSTMAAAPISSRAERDLDVLGVQQSCCPSRAAGRRPGTPSAPSDIQPTRRRFTVPLQVDRRASRPHHHGGNRRWRWPRQA